MQIWDSSRSWLLGVTLVGAALLAPKSARASEQFPAVMQELTGMPCTPSCTLCHGVDPGTANTFQDKKLGKTLFAIKDGAIVGKGDTAAIRTNYAIYAADPANAAAVADLKAGIDPETKTSLCGPTYGCGAHVASKQPPRDLSPMLWVSAAVALGALVRRKRSRTD